MSSAAQIPSSSLRRHRDPPVLWQAVLITSLVLHVAALFTLRRFQVDIVAIKPSPPPIPVEIIGLAAPSGTGQMTKTTTLTTPNPTPKTPQPVVERPASVSAPKESAIVPPSPAPPAPALPPTPLPSPLLTSVTVPRPSAVPPAQSSPIPDKSAGNPPSAPPTPKPPIPDDGFARLPVKSNPPPLSPSNSGNEPLPSTPPIRGPVGSDRPIAAALAAVNTNIDHYRLTDRSKLEAGGEVILKVTPPPQLELAFFGGLQPGTGQELTAKVQFAVDHATSEALLDTIHVLPDSPALQQRQMTAENLDSLVKKALQRARFEVTNNSAATNKAALTEWETTLVFKVL